MSLERPLLINGVPVHERLTAALPGLTSEVVGSILEKVPFYRELPAEEIAGDIHRVVAENLRKVATLVRERRPPDPAELSWFAESAVRRAEEGVPLEMVLDAYFVGAQEGWRLASADARPEDISDLRATTDLVMGHLRAVMATVSAAYVEELRATYSEEQSIRHTLLSALLGGEPAEEAAERAGVRLPAGYLVLALRIGEHADEREGGVGAAIAARRKLRRLQAELGRYSDEPPLSVVDPSGGTVLLPSALGLDASWVSLVDVVRHMAAVGGAEVTAAVAYAAPGDVADAAAEAREVLDVVRITGRPGGLYRLADVLLEYQLSRATPATRALAALLEPLAGNADLLTTLRLHLDNELNRRRTAKMLHIHPNTVDYRLRRITTLTGLDPAIPSHLPLFAAALAARDVPKPTLGT